jgi:hypothetical protein
MGRQGEEGGETCPDPLLVVFLDDEGGVGLDLQWLVVRIAWTQRQGLAKGSVDCTQLPGLSYDAALREAGPVVPGSSRGAAGWDLRWCPNGLSCVMGHFPSSAARRGNLESLSWGEGQEPDCDEKGEMNSDEGPEAAFGSREGCATGAVSSWRRVPTVGREGCITPFPRLARELSRITRSVVTRHLGYGRDEDPLKLRPGRRPVNQCPGTRRVDPMLGRGIVQFWRSMVGSCARMDNG